MCVLALYLFKALLIMIGFYSHDSSSFVVAMFQQAFIGLVAGYLT